MTPNNPAPQHLTPLEEILNARDIEIAPEPAAPSNRKNIRSWQRKQGKRGFRAKGGNARAR